MFFDDFLKTMQWIDSAFYCCFVNFCDLEACAKD